MSEFLIWSNQHGAWWRPAERGYTQSIDEAGRYPRVIAERIVAIATCDGLLVHTRTNPITGEGYEQFDEVLVLAPEADSSGWIVARDGGRYCERCEGEVQRGQAYQAQPGTGGLLQHIHCPDQGEQGCPNCPDGFDCSTGNYATIPAADQASGADRG